MAIGIIVTFISLSWVFCEALLARQDQMLTAKQMRNKYPNHTFGLPFMWHFGMWGDVFLLSPLLGWLIATFSNQWSMSEMGIAILAATVLSTTFHWFYLKTPFPDSLAWAGGLTAAGWMHSIYTAAALVVFELLFFSTEKIGYTPLIVTAVCMAINTTISSKVFLGLLNIHIFKRHWLPTLHKDRNEQLLLVGIYLILVGIVITSV